jgi:hypothetical protein
LVYAKGDSETALRIRRAASISVNPTSSGASGSKASSSVSGKVVDAAGLGLVE